jgi:Domain of unknown function (DUF1963)
MVPYQQLMTSASPMTKNVLAMVAIERSDACSTPLPFSWSVWLRLAPACPLAISVVLRGVGTTPSPPIQRRGSTLRMDDLHVKTRTFVRDHEGECEELALRWGGLHVDVGVSKVGALPRASSHAFASEADVHAYLHARVQEARAQGFRETTSPLGATVGDDEGDEAARVAARHRRTAWVPVVEPGEGPAEGSRFGGRPWLRIGEAWPCCGRCGQPAHFVVQLATALLPAELTGDGRGGLIQLFLCDRDCQSMGGAEPFDPATIARRLAPGPGRLASPPCPEVVFPAKQVARWQALDDYPAFEDVLLLEGDEAHEVAEVLSERNVEATPGEKLGGWPCWLQTAEYPACAVCGGRMQCLLQIDSNGTLPVQLGDAGIGWLVHCARCDAMTFQWQCG